jgi:hypothetical protein
VLNTTFGLPWIFVFSLFLVFSIWVCFSLNFLVSTNEQKLNLALLCLVCSILICLSIGSTEMDFIKPYFWWVFFFFFFYFFFSFSD